MQAGKILMVLFCPTQIYNFINFSLMREKSEMSDFKFFKQNSNLQIGFLKMHDETKIP